MDNTTTTSSNPLQGSCPAPFLDLTQFPSSGGYLAGRLCSEVRPGLTCCLPCPATDWIYPDSFKTWQKVAQGFGVAGLVVCVFLLLSWICLPPEKSKRQYLTTCLVIGILIEVLAFVIPLAAKPNQCHNDITPNDMKSDVTCAFSGACVMLGGLVGCVWIAFRALSMHLQICWNIVPGKKFFYISLVVGWSVAAALFLIAMAVTGVSYRFGDTCHVNPDKALADFWAPLLVLASIAALLQLGTLLYCCKVYMANALSDTTESTASGFSGLPTYNSSTRTQSARVVWRRVQRIIFLQWRSMTIIAFLLVDIIFFSVVWIELDNAVGRVQSGKAAELGPFLTCILANPTVDTRATCFPLGQDVLISEKITVVVLLLLALTGMQCGLLMIRTTMLTGWVQLVRDLVHPPQEFVSFDVKSGPSGTQSMPVSPFIPSRPRVTSAGTIDTARTAVDLLSLDETASICSKSSPYRAQSPFERPYRQPRGSFSTPRPSSSHLSPRLATAGPSPRPTYEPGLTQWSSIHPTQSEPDADDDEINS